MKQNCGCAGARPSVSNASAQWCARVIEKQGVLMEKEWCGVTGSSLRSGQANSSITARTKVACRMSCARLAHARTRGVAAAQMLSGPGIGEGTRGGYIRASRVTRR